MKLLKFAGVLGALSLLMGCASNIDRMAVVQASGGSAFTQALTKEYQTFVAHEKDPDYDWTGADFYALKGLASARGELVLPEEVTDVTVHADALIEARGRLMAALDGGARESNPTVAAEAQVAFDCWLHEAQEVDSWLADGALPESHLASCHDKFEAAMANLAPKAEAMVPTAEPHTYLVLFDFDKSNIREDARAVINQVLADAAAQGIGSVNISATGHADRSGSVDYNIALSMRRADAVREALIAGGVAADAITVAGRGESENAVPTEDGVKEQANRRVEIILQ
jgi:OOP family OmpA-OmpF porin